MCISFVQDEQMVGEHRMIPLAPHTRVDCGDGLNCYQVNGAVGQSLVPLLGEGFGTLVNYFQPVMLQNTIECENVIF